MSSVELVRYAQQKGLSAIAITDHDTIDGVSDAVAAGVALGIEVVPGIELSVKYSDQNVHLLGYFLDCQHKELHVALSKLQAGRLERNINIIANLNRLGLAVEFSELQKRAGSGQHGRPHIAKLMIEKQFVKTMDEAFEKYVAGPLGCSVEEAAFDSWRVVNANMTQAVQRTTAGKGIDPRDLTMLAYGGNGPVFAAIQAQDLGIRKVLVPKASPTFSALGALAAQPAIDEERSYLVAAADADLDRLTRLWLELDERAERYFLAAGFERADITASYQLNLRYPGQNWALTLDIAEVEGKRDLSFVTSEMLERAVDGFHGAHQEEYGHRREGEAPEITGIRLQTSTEITKPNFSGECKAKRIDAKPVKSRRANLGQGFADTKIYSGPSLEPGRRVVGPGIIEETFTTIVVYPGWEAIVDDSGDYLLEALEASEGNEAT
jgi:N-methylhydantoinase A/oxoprolinase/acetone carboxylase beta subunit